MEQQLSKSLETLAGLGVRGAKEARARHASVHDSAVMLRAINPVDTSAVFEQLLRAVHQRWLTRTGNIELLLASLGSDQAGLGTAARKHFTSTLRGRILTDKSKVYVATVAFLSVTVAAAALLAMSCIGLKIEWNKDLRGIIVVVLLAVLKRVSWVVACIGVSVSTLLAGLCIVRVARVSARWAYPNMQVSRGTTALLSGVAFTAAAVMTCVTGVARPFVFVAAAGWLISAT